MPYVLVILRPGANADDKPLHEEAHERFIDSLIERNLVLLGGGFAEATVGGADGAYLLRCGSLEEAHELVATDPYVSNDVARASPVVWELVGINTDAIDAAVVLRPEDL